MSAPPNGNAYANYDLKAEAPSARRPGVRFAFEFPELLAEFEKADAVAGRARDRNRQRGMCGIAFVLLALLYASIAPLLHEAHPAAMGIMGYLVATLGLIGTVLGLSGLRRGSLRMKWLESRFKTETLRLFHFHYVVARLPDLEAAGTDPQLQQAYVDARLQAFEELKRNEVARARERLEEIIELREHDPFAHVPSQHPSKPLSAGSREIFDAWSELRLDWQMKYCEAKLATVSTARQRSPRQWEHGFSTLAWVCISIVVLLHLVHFMEDWIELSTLWMEAAIVCAALVALGARALEDGLKPQREVERYEQYLANLKVARRRFDTAPDFRARLEVMRAMEQVSLEEMRTFLRTHAKSRYLL